MIGRRLVARLLGRSLLLVLAAGALVALPGTGSAGRAELSPLQISPIKAVFEPSPQQPRQTLYGVPTVTDTPGAAIHYEWKLTLEQVYPTVDPSIVPDPKCDNHGTLAGFAPTFIWRHSNVGEPDILANGDGIPGTCDHSKGTILGHQGLITVTVSDDAGWQCTATYKGTESSTDQSVANGVASTPACSKRPPCQCRALVAIIVPSSVKLKDSASGMELDFKISWAMDCSSGSEGCRGTLVVIAPQKIDSSHKTVYSTKWKERDLFARQFDIACKGPCGGSTQAYAELTLLGSHGLSPSERADLGSIPIVIHRTCQITPLKATTLSIAFNGKGHFDRKDSKLTH